MYRLCVLVVFFLLFGCGTRTSLAPVVELKWHPRNKIHQTTHLVHRGETLYSIAFHYDLDYRQLAQMNGIDSPYTLRAGQFLKLKPSLIRRSTPVSRYKMPTKVAATPLSPRRRVQSQHLILRTQPPKALNGQWFWPIRGRIAARFSPQQGKKGIDIAGRKGEKIQAAAAGVVAYAGSGLSGYGNLIIIKHNDHFLTAYGNNSRNIVKEGQKVKAGQMIGEIGVIDRNYWGVHFEIRRDGMPVNPLDYLKN
jgi:lipoprotein NlpD